MSHNLKLYDVILQRFSNRNCQHIYHCLQNCLLIETLKMLFYVFYELSTQKQTIQPPCHTDTLDSLTHMQHNIRTLIPAAAPYPLWLWHSWHKPLLLMAPLKSPHKTISMLINAALNNVKTVKSSTASSLKHP